MSFVNAAVMRNYAAHHECLDHELFSLRWAAAGLEALLVIGFALLGCCEPPISRAVAGTRGKKGRSPWGERREES